MESLNNILNSIAPAVERLAQLFNTSADFIQANFMEYVMMHGKYQAFENSLWVVGIMFGIALFFVSVLSFYAFLEGGFMEIAKIMATTLIIAFIVFSLVAFITCILPYLVSPEIYSLKALMNLVR